MPLRPFKLERFFARYEFKAPHILCSAATRHYTLGDLLDLEPDLEARIRSVSLGYPDTIGTPALRSAVSHLYPTLSPEDILIHNGSAEAIYTVLNTLLQPGDHVIVQFPCYQSLSEVARSRGCEVSRWALEAESDQWLLELDHLASLIRPETKAIVINQPHNPTGFLMTHPRYQHLVELADRNDLWIVADEVYRWLEHNPADRLPAMADSYRKGISIGGLSKAVGLPGLRIGWVAARDRNLIAQIAAFKDYTSLSHSSVSDAMAQVALKHWDRLLEQNLALISENLPLLSRFMNDHADLIDWIPPSAGTVAFPWFKSPLDVEAFCIKLVEETGVMLLPGTVYDLNTPHFRIGFGHAGMPQALSIFDTWLRSDSPNPLYHTSTLG